MPYNEIPQICLQEAICSSLEDYNQQIEKLKEEMNDATHGADNIRNDISALAQRYTIIERDEECGVIFKCYFFHDYLKLIYNLYVDSYN